MRLRSAPPTLEPRSTPRSPATMPTAPRIVGGIADLLAGTPASPEETFFIVRRFLAALATTQPVLFAIDDLQWAEPLLLDLIEHLIQWSRDVPLLVLAASRPELRDARSSLASVGALVTEVVTLGGLDAGAATRLAANVVGAAELPAAVAGRVLATSEGNPLFLGELVRMLVNDGALKQEGDRWTAAVDLAALDMPPTIQALLAARIERLRPEDPHGAGARCRRRTAVLAQRHRALVAARDHRPRRAARIASAQRVDRARHRLVPRRAGAALSPRADARCGVSACAEGDAAERTVASPTGSRRAGRRSSRRDARLAPEQASAPARAGPIDA